MIINKKVKFKKISKLNEIKTILFDAKIEYLFLLAHPTKNNSNVKQIDIIDINSILYSISNKLKLGPHIKLIQNK